jgi:hypothetical protein
VAGLSGPARRLICFIYPDPAHKVVDPKHPALRIDHVDAMAVNSSHLVTSDPRHHRPDPMGSWGWLPHADPAHKVVDPKHLVLRIDHVDAMAVVPTTRRPEFPTRRRLPRACPDPQLAIV